MAGYPDGAAFIAYLQEIGIYSELSNPDTGAARRIAAAILDWENDCQWFPFLSSGLVEPRTMVAGVWVDFRGGLLELSSVTASGVALVEGTDFVLTEPDRRPGFPATGMELRRCHVNTPLVVSGKWGRVTSIPEDVEEAILKRAAAKAIKDSQGVVGAMNKLKEGPVEYGFSVEAGRSTVDQMQVEYAITLERYARWRIAG